MDIAAGLFGRSLFYQNPVRNNGPESWHSENQKNAFDTVAAIMAARAMPPVTPGKIQTFRSATSFFVAMCSLIAETFSSSLARHSRTSPPSPPWPPPPGDLPACLSTALSLSSLFILLLKPFGQAGFGAPGEETYFDHNVRCLTVSPDTLQDGLREKFISTDKGNFPIKDVVMIRPGGTESLLRFRARRLRNDCVDTHIRSTAGLPDAESNDVLKQPEQIIFLSRAMYLVPSQLPGRVPGIMQG